MIINLNIMLMRSLSIGVNFARDKLAPIPKYISTLTRYQNSHKIHQQQRVTNLRQILKSVRDPIYTYSINNSNFVWHKIISYTNSTSV